MTRMTRPDCAVMCNLINTHTHTHITETGPGVKTSGQTQQGNTHGSGDGNEGSIGDGNEDGDEIEEGGGQAKKRKKPHRS